MCKCLPIKIYEFSSLRHKVWISIVLGSYGKLEASPIKFVWEALISISVLQSIYIDSKILSKLYR